MWTPEAGHSTQKPIVSSWHMEDTSITPAVPTSGSTVLNQNLLASSCLICSEKFLNKGPTGFCFFPITPHEVTGSQKQNAGTVQCTSVKLYEDSPSHSGDRGAAGFPVLPTDALCPLGSRCQSWGFEVKSPCPDCTWYQKFANLPLVLVRCLKTRTTVFFL